MTNGELAVTPEPPYTAAIFTSVRTEGDDGGKAGGRSESDGYEAMADRMFETAQEQPGFLGADSARDAIGITVSYWVDDAAARAWKQVAEHLGAQRLGREKWYSQYRVRIATVTREY